MVRILTAILLSALVIAPAAAKQFKVYRTNEFGFAENSPYQVIEEKDGEIRIYDLESHGDRGPDPVKVIPKGQAQGETRVYETDAHGFIAPAPSLILKREPDGRHVQTIGADGAMARTPTPRHVTETGADGKIKIYQIDGTGIDETGPARVIDSGPLPPEVDPQLLFRGQPLYRGLPAGAR
jgi:hypothetical protein